MEKRKRIIKALVFAAAVFFCCTAQSCDDPYINASSPAGSSQAG